MLSRFLINLQTFAATVGSSDNCRTNAGTGRRLFLLVSVGLSSADDQAQRPSTTSHEGYIDCSSEANHYLVPVFLGPCQQPVGNLACGQKLIVLERYSPSWLKILTPDGITRYTRSLSVSQAPDKFVAFDEHSDIPKGDAADCSYSVERVRAGVSAPHPISTPDPEYTDEARRAGYEGSCQLQMIVGEDGKTHDVKVVRPVGHGLDEKAIEAVKQWKFTPAMKAGKPVAVQINDFSLRGTLGACWAFSFQYRIQQLGIDPRQPPRPAHPADHLSCGSPDQPHLARIHHDSSASITWERTASRPETGLLMCFQQLTPHKGRPKALAKPKSRPKSPKAEK